MTEPTAPKANDTWDAQRIFQLAEDWFHPLVEARTWHAVAYLSVGLATGVGFFAATVAFGAVVFALCFVGVGVLLFGAFFRMVDTFATAERAMASWIGMPIEPRAIRPIRGLGFAAVRDADRWRQVGYLLANIVLAPTLFSLGVTLLAPLFKLSGNAWPLGPIIGLLLLGALPRLAIVVARLKQQIAAWFLGPDLLAVAEARVSTLSSQRQDILDAVAAERRRIERNLHDGVQQQLVAIGLDLGMAERAVDNDPQRAKELLGLARQKVQGSIGELRNLGRGLHPAILDDRGLDAALSAVAANASIPLSVRIDEGLELPTDVQATVWFVVNEAIANVLKHARARGASIDVAKVGANVRVTVHDDGCGGASVEGGTGIAGIRARVHGVDGVLTLSSPAGGPTTLVAEIPRYIVRDDGVVQQ